MRRLKNTSETRDRYRAMVEASTEASVYHTPEWLSVFEALSYEVEFVDAGDVMIPFVCKGTGVFRRGFSLPYDTYGGAVSGASQLSYDDVIESLGIPSARIVDFGARTNGTRCVVEHATTHIVHLHDDYDSVASRYAQMNRRAIRQAERRGLVVSEAGDGDVATFYRFYLDSCRRYGSPPLPLRFFDAVNRIMVPKGLARFYIARHNERPVAGNLVLRYGERAYDWTWGYDRSTNAMVDRAIRDEIAQGTVEFNLGASPANNNGNAQFKENFGAKSYTYPILSRTGLWYDTARRIRYHRLWPGPGTLRRG
jgi:hypothetical protein